MIVKVICINFLASQKKNHFNIYKSSYIDQKQRMSKLSLVSLCHYIEPIIFEEIEQNQQNLLVIDVTILPQK